MYSIYRKRCAEVDPNLLTLEKQYELWTKTVQENIYVICKTPMARAITRRTLLGYRSGKMNAHAFDDLLMQLKDKPEQFREKILRGSFWNKEVKEMKFDAVVGNPPYQEDNDNNSRKPPIYHLFYDISFKLSNKATLITPARFLFNAGQTPQKWNEKMLQDEHIKVVSYYPNSKDIFDSVDIKGGVAVIYRDEQENFGIIGVFTQYAQMNAILKKVVKGTTGTSLSEVVSSRGHYRFTEKLFTDYPFASKRLGKGTGNMIASNVFDLLPEVFTDTAVKDSLKFLGRTNNERVYKYVKREYIQENEYTPSYKILLPKSNGTGSFGECLSTPIISMPGECSTDTFVSIGLLKSLIEAKALLNYVKTKFARTLLGVKKVTQDNPKSVWEYIPLQDFTENSDIDWSKSIPEIDKQLYAKYNLTEEEISFIESMIKPME